MTKAERYQTGVTTGDPGWLENIGGVVTINTKGGVGLECMKGTVREFMDQCSCGKLITLPCPGNKEPLRVETPHFMHGRAGRVSPEFYRCLMRHVTCIIGKNLLIRLPSTAQSLTA